MFSIQARPNATCDTSSEKMENEHILSFFHTIRNRNYIICQDNLNGQHYIARMQKEASEKKWGWFFQLQFLYVTFILEVLRNLVNAPPIPDQYGTDNIALACTRYLHSNYHEPTLSVQDLADHFHMSTRHINRLFRDFFGCSPTKTLPYYRINYAKSFIQKTDYSVETIAERVGFKSTSTLSRLFKEIEGITISEYRKSLENR